MKNSLFHEKTTYESTSDEWKEYAHQHFYYLDERAGTVTCRTIVEFQDTRSGTDTVVSDTTIEVARGKLPHDVAADLASFEKKAVRKLSETKKRPR